VKVTHVITGLYAGGAEAMLQKVVAASRADGLEHSVVSLLGSGIFGEMLRAEGVPVTSLGTRRGISGASALPALLRILRRDRPDVVQGWMYHANLAAGLAGAVARIPVVWGIHHADVDPRTVKRLTRWTRAASARLSGVLPARIVCCAESARRAHASIGYRDDRMVVIPNGFDLERFRRDPAGGARVRAELSIPAAAGVVTVLARFHPDKDHRTFLDAARRVAAALPDATFMLAGTYVRWETPALAALVDEHGLRDRVRLLGVRGDVRDLLSATDVLALPSRTEGFPNVLGEAMSCGVPCATTDVGDAREIVGSTGRIVPPGDGAALGAALLDLLALSPSARAEAGVAARGRIRERYEIRAVARRYAALYEEVLFRRAA
jgi:glycosyltransferase involved in cell wall biosynthesis